MFLPLRKKYQNIINKFYPVIAIGLLLILWQGLISFHIVDNFLLPTPIQVLHAFIDDFSILMEHTRITLIESFLGLGVGIILAFLVAIALDRYQWMYHAFHPLLIITQTIPTVAIAPLLVLWFGFEMTPKIILIVITTFFPITVGLLAGFRSVDKDSINLLKSMGANTYQIFIHIKLPGALEHFFSGLKVSASYAIVGAVISEWIGGFQGLGVYMTRVKQAYAFDKMFAVIFLISAISLLLMKSIELIQRAAMPWTVQNMTAENRKKQKFSPILLFIILLLVAIFWDNKSTADKQELKNSDTMENITFVLDWTPNTNHTGLYVAIQEGYFKEEGINVTVVQPPEDGAEVLVASGKAQFGISFQDTMAPALADDTPLPITAVAAVLQHNTSGIISRKGEGIDSPKGLENKRYSTWNGAIELATIAQIMKNVDADYNKINLIPSTVTDEVSALRENMTDAIWIFYGWAGVKTELENLDTDYFSFAEIDPVFDYYTPVIISGNDYLKQHPDTAKAFLRALTKGYEFAIEHPDEAANILCQTAPELDEALVQASQKYLSKHYQADATQWGIIDEKRWNAFYEWLNTHELVTNKLPENIGFSNDYLPKNKK